MVIDAFKEVGGLASTDVTPEGFLYDVRFSPAINPPTPNRRSSKLMYFSFRLEDMLFSRITSILTMR